MLYGEKLKQHLKIEKNAINKMYLNELLINWQKVDTAIEEGTGSPISTMISAISTYTKYLSNPKFKYNVTKKCGFSEEHDVFKVHYLYDIVEKLLAEAGIRDAKQGLFIKNTKTFNTGLSLKRDTFENQRQKPKFELHLSNKCYYVGLEFDVQYKLASKKQFDKAKINIPLIIIYIDRFYTEKSFDEIRQLRKDMVKLNPDAMMICLTESVDKKYLHLYSEIEEHLYVARCNFKDDEYKDYQPQVFLSMFKKISNFATKELCSYDLIAPFGHVDLVNKAMLFQGSDTEADTDEE